MKLILLALVASIGFSQAATAGQTRRLNAAEERSLQLKLTAQGSDGIIRACSIDLELYESKEPNQWGGPVTCRVSLGTLGGTISFDDIKMTNGQVTDGKPLDIWLMDELPPR